MTLSKKIPDALTTWVTTAFCVHDDRGFGILQNNFPLMVNQSLNYSEMILGILVGNTNLHLI